MLTVVAICVIMRVAAGWHERDAYRRWRVDEERGETHLWHVAIESHQGFEQRYWWSS